MGGERKKLRNEEEREKDRGRGMERRETERDGVGERLGGGKN